MKKLVKIGALVLVVVLVIVFATEKKQPVPYHLEQVVFPSHTVYCENDIEEYTDRKMDRAPFTLPVYADHSDTVERYSKTEMKKIAEEYCQKLGWTIVTNGYTGDWYLYYTIKCEEGRVMAYSSGNVRIEEYLDRRIPLSTFGCGEDEDMISCMKKVYETFAHYRQPELQIERQKFAANEKITWYRFYEGAASAGQQLVNELKRSVRIRVENDERKIARIDVQVPDKIEYVGSYRTITQKQAKKKLLTNDWSKTPYISFNNYPVIAEEDIVKVDIIYGAYTHGEGGPDIGYYRKSDWLVPYYRFFVERTEEDWFNPGVKTYDSYCVLALAVNENGEIDK